MGSAALGCAGVLMTLVIIAVPDGEGISDLMNALPPGSSWVDVEIDRHVLSLPFDRVGPQFFEPAYAALRQRVNAPHG